MAASIRFSWVGVGSGLLCAALSSALISCGARENNFGEEEESGSEEGAAQSSESGEGESGGEATGEEDGGEMVFFDTLDGMEGIGEGSLPQQCEKIDFLFVLDDSGSMFSAQQGLREAFPAFAESILTNVGVEDHHVLVVDSDDKVKPDECAGDGGVTLDPVVPKEECDETFGAGNMIKLNYTDPDSYGWSNPEGEERCDLGEDRRFLKSSDADFLEKFECIAGVGALGTGREKPITSAVHALREQKDACNAGFLRDDAILVVVIVSDDFPNDTYCPGDAEAQLTDVSEWIDAIYESKGGQEEAVTTIFFHSSTELSVVATFDAFVEQMGDRLIESQVYDENYMPIDFAKVFEESVVKIQESCEDFVPIG